MRVTIHVGAGKTGSSAIQHSLATNTTALSRQGLYIAPMDLEVDGKVTGYQVFRFEELKRLSTEEASRTFASQFAALKDHAESTGANNIVLSAENLSNEHPWAEVVQAGLSGCDVGVVMYIRRQDQYLLSAWQQWGLKTGTSFDEWLLQNIDNAGDWRVPIRVWAQLLGKDKLVVRLYERPRLVDNDVVADFYHCLGINDSGFNTSRGQVNSSYSLAAEELALASGSLFSGANDNGFFNFLDRVGIAGHKKQSNESRLSLRERRLILNRYRECNEWIRKEFFADDETVPEYLFRGPTEQESQQVADSEVTKRMIGLMAELIYGEHQDRHRK